MIYTGDSEYQVKFYREPRTGRSLVFEYVDQLREKEKAKVIKYIEFLRIHQGYLDEPYSKHIKGKIRELRVDFGRNRHRVFYFTFVGKKIILLHAFLKRTAKTAISEIEKAEANYQNVFTNPKAYD